MYTTGAMNAPVRLLAFASLLAGVFALAAFAGDQADLGRGEPAAHEAAGGHGSGGSTHPDERVDPVRGLAASEDGLTLELSRTRAPADKRFELGVRVVDASGATVRGFDVEHTKRMHLIVVRRDLTGFQHLHPVQAADGSWSVPLTLDDPGSHRVFADFSTGGEPRTLAGEVSVDGDVRSKPLPATTGSVEVDGLRVALASGDAGAGEAAELSFDVTRGGEPVAVERYLGAQGHLVALREGDLAFLHVHPDADRLRFMAQFPSAGRYRLFLQFKTRGRVHTAAFTEQVTG